MMLIDLVNISGNLESIKRNTIMKSLITIEPKEITRDRCKDLDTVMILFRNRKGSAG
jgi:hypothetical protein